MTVSDRPSFRARRRALGQRSALAAVLAASALLPAAAQAQAACGAPEDGVITCPADAGRYPDGIAYRTVDPVDLTLRLADGAVVEPDSVGGIILSNSGGGATIEAANTRITTRGDSAAGIFASTTAAPLSVAASIVETSGTGSVGIVATSLTGPIRVTADSITTGGDGSDGIAVVTRDGAVAIDVDAVMTQGVEAVGIDARVDGTGSIAIRAGEVTTFGPGSTGISTLNYGDGATTISVDHVRTYGDSAGGVRALSYAGDVRISAGEVASFGSYAPAILGYSAFGDVTIDAGNVAAYGSGGAGVAAITVSGDIAVDLGNAVTGGYNTPAIRAESLEGDIRIGAGSLTTFGEGSGGVYAKTIYGDVDVSVEQVAARNVGAYGVFAGTIYGDTKVEVGDVDVGRQGVIAYSAYGTTELTVGDVRTNDLNGIGVFAGGGSGLKVDVGSVDTTRDYSAGVQVRTGSYFTRGDAEVTIGSVETSGFGSVGVSAQHNGSATLDVGSVRTRGDYADAIASLVVEGSSAITVGSAETLGYRANAIRAVGYGGALTIEAGDLSTGGDIARGAFVETLGGDLSLTLTGDTDTGGYYSEGVLAIARGGDMTIRNQGTITTAGDRADGISAAIRSGHADIAAGTVRTAGDDSHGIDVFAASFDGDRAIAVTADRVETSGDRAIGILLRNPDDGVIAGALRAPDRLAEAAPNRDIQLVSGTVLTSGAGSAGIVVSGVGDVLVDAGTTKAEKAAALVIGARGFADVTLRGETSGAAPQAVTVAGRDALLRVEAGAEVRGAGDAIFLQGRGTFVPSPIDPSVYPGTYLGGGTVTLDNAGTIAANATAVHVEAGDAILNNSGTIVGGGAARAGEGPSDAIRIDNSGRTRLTNSGTIAVRADGGTTVRATGPIELVNSGTLIGGVATEGDATIRNSGLFEATRDSSFGGTADLFVNSGTVRLGTAKGSPTSVALRGLEHFENAGLIDLRNDRGGDVLSLSGGYVGGSGARLAIDVPLDGTGSADRLAIGGAATGATLVTLAPVGDRAPALLAQPIRVVTVGAGSSATAFALNPAAADVGFLRYDLRFDAAASAFDLRNGAGPAAYRLARTNETAENLWLRSADAWSGHMRQLRDSHTAEAPGGRIWGQMEGGTDRRGGSKATLFAGGTAEAISGYDQDVWGIQLGVDAVDAEHGGFVAGATGGYQSSHVKTGADRLDYDAANIGGYAGVAAGALFGNLLAKYDHYWISADNAVLGYSDTFRGHSLGVQGEAGVRLGSDTFFVEPVASLAYVKTDLGDLRAAGQILAFAEAEGLRGRAGARVGGSVALADGSTVVFHLSGRAVHEFEGRDGLTLRSGGTSQVIAADRLDSYGQASIGLSVLGSGPLSGFIEAEGDFGSPYHGGRGKAGLRIRF